MRRARRFPRFLMLAAALWALSAGAEEAEGDVEEQTAAEADEGEAAPQITLEDMLQQVVTVERRVQNLLDVGVTAFTFDGQSLQIRGVQNLTDLSELAPGLEIGNKQGNIEVWIRGVGSSNNTELGDPAAATHLDGVYIPRPSGIGSVFFDIARVEVNIGPQGTLRGRNATAGTVNIIPWRPGLGVWDAAFELETGDYEQAAGRGMVNIPFGDNAAFRLAVYGMKHDSYYNDVGPMDVGTAEEEDNEGYRAQLLIEPTERASVLLSYDSVSERGTGYTGTNYANPLGHGVLPSEIEDPRDVFARAFKPKLATDHDGAKLELRYDFDLVTVEYIASRRDLLYDYDAVTPLSPDWLGSWTRCSRWTRSTTTGRGSSSSPTASPTSTNCASWAKPPTGFGPPARSGSARTSTRSWDR